VTIYQNLKLPDLIALVNRIVAIEKIKQTLKRQGIYFSINSIVNDGYCIRIPLNIEQRNFILDFIIDEYFPFSQIKVILKNFDQFLKWPHFERDGTLCLDENFTINPFKPEYMFIIAYEQSVKLIKQCLHNTLESDFEDEFLAYWTRYIESQGTVLSYYLVSLPKKEIQSLYCCGNIKNQLVEYYISADENQLNDYCFRQNIKSRKEKNILFVVLDHPPRPDNYGNLLNLILKKIKSKQNNFNYFKQYVKKGTFKVVCAFKSNNGYMFVGLTINSPLINPKKFKRSTFEKYRNLFTLVNNSNFKIKKAYHNWVYGRDQDINQDLLMGKRVAIIGCGSIGSFVLKNLVMSGVSNITVIDPDILDFANVSRNCIGTNFVGCFKTKAIKYIINKEHPLAEILDKAQTCQTFFSNNNMEEYDLIICCTADYASEMFLMKQLIDSKKNTPIIFAFAETGAVVGHCISILSPSESCFQCGFNDATAQFQFLVCQNKKDSLKKEPGCGGYYNPYGEIEINYINLMTSRIALDILLGKEKNNSHHLWISDRCQLFDLTEFGKKIITSYSYNSFIKLPWLSNKNCYYRDKHGI